MVLCASFVAMALAFFAGSASAVTILNTGIDTYIASYAPDECYGVPGNGAACAATAVDPYYGVKWDDSANGGAEHGLLWFELSPELLAAFAATPGATATLTYEVNDNSSSPAAAMHRMSVDWISPGGNSVTWNNLGCSSGVGGVDISGSCTTAVSTSNASAPGTTGVHMVDVSLDVLAWAMGESNYGWGFLPQGGSGAGLDTFENGTAPTLTLSVDPIPEPTTALLFGLGLAGLAAIRR